jgi:hypothetical protein
MQLLQFGIISIDMGDFDDFFRDYFEKKMSSTLAWSKKKLGIKTLNPIAIIKQKAQVLFTWNGTAGNKNTTHRFIDKTTN